MGPEFTRFRMAAAKQIEHLQAENAALRAWKESALAVQAEMDEQAIAKILGGQLGRSCRKIIAERVPELVAENAALRKALNDLCSVADSAMREANRHTAYSWEIEKELEPAMRALSQNQNP